MVAASRTLISAAGIWTIVIVMVLVLAFWLAAIVLADRSQARASGRARLAGDTGPAMTGAWAGGSVPGARAPEIPGEAAHEPILAPADARGAEAPDTEAPDTEARGGPHQRPDLPRQRGGEADRAERSHTGRAAPDDGGQDR